MPWATSAAEQDRAAAVLAEAFSTDPAVRWFLPGLTDAARRARLTGWFGALGRRGGHLVQLSASGEGAALWRPPGRAAFSTRETIVLLPTVARTWLRWPHRTLLGVRAVEHGHPTAPHWYLDYVGVTAAARGRGIGGELLREGAGWAGGDGVGTHLNASSASSRRLYERHGFGVTRAYALPLGGPPQWHMWRPPAGG